MWVERLLSLGQVARDLSVGLACPFHCGGSLALPFLLGLVTGLLLGIILSVCCFLCVLTHYPVPGLARAHPVPSSTSSIIRRRLAGYIVHE